MSNRPSYVNLGSAINSDAKQKRTNAITQNEKIVESPSNSHRQLYIRCGHKSPQDVKENQSLSENPSRNYKTTPTTPTKARPSFYLRQSSETNRSLLEANKYRNRSNTFNVEKEILNRARNKLEQYVCDTNERTKKCTCEDIREINLKNTKEEEDICIENRTGFTLWQKIWIFFDLDLLKDITYINIMIGITIGEKKPVSLD